MSTAIQKIGEEAVRSGGGPTADGGAATTNGAKTAPSILLALLLASCIPLAHATTLRVGPGEKITRIADGKNAELAIENSEFSRNGTGDGKTHNLYVGTIAKLSVTGSRFHTVNAGHLIESLARQSDIRYNFIFDGAEGKVWPDNSLTLIHNTLVSDYFPGAWFLRVHEEKFSTPPKVAAFNNLTVGPGVFTLGARGEFHGNLPALAFMLADPQALDFRLSVTGLARLLGFFTEKPPADLIPTAEFTLPVGTRPLAPGGDWSPGALQPAH